MAVFESGLFSRLSGSFGNVTMYRLGDSNVVKGKRWARDARTPLQLIHRAKWKVLGLLAMRMKKVLELGFPGREARGRVNGFMSRNLPCMTTGFMFFSGIRKCCGQTCYLYTKEKKRRKYALHFRKNGRILLFIYTLSP